MNDDDVLRRAKQPKGTTLCPALFFGGPHSWNDKTDRCYCCGISRAEARTLAKFKLQPALGCEEYGHPRPDGWTVFPWPPAKPAPARRLCLAVDNSRRAR